MVSACVALGCKNRGTKASKEKGITFHRFPVENLRKASWIKAVNRMDPKTRKLWLPASRDVLCSEHFKKTDFMTERQRKVLTIDAVPVYFDSKPKKGAKTKGKGAVKAEKKMSFGARKINTESLLTSLEQMKPVDQKEKPTKIKPSPKPRRISMIKSHCVRKAQNLDKSTDSAIAQGVEIKSEPKTAHDVEMMSDFETAPNVEIKSELKTDPESDANSDFETASDVDMKSDFETTPHFEVRDIEASPDVGPTKDQETTIDKETTIEIGVNASALSTASEHNPSENQISAIPQTLIINKTYTPWTVNQLDHSYCMNDAKLKKNYFMMAHQLATTRQKLRNVQKREAHCRKALKKVVEDLRNGHGMLNIALTVKRFLMGDSRKVHANGEKERECHTKPSIPSTKVEPKDATELNPDPVFTTPELPQDASNLASEVTSTLPTDYPTPFTEFGTLPSEPTFNATQGLTLDSESALNETESVPLKDSFAPFTKVGTLPSEPTFNATQAVTLDSKSALDATESEPLKDSFAPFTEVGTLPSEPTSLLVNPSPIQAGGHDIESALHATDSEKLTFQHPETSETVTINIGSPQTSTKAVTHPIVSALLSAEVKIPKLPIASVLPYKVCYEW